MVYCGEACILCTHTVGRFFLTVSNDISASGTGEACDAQLDFTPVQCSLENIMLLQLLKLFTLHLVSFIICVYYISLIFFEWSINSIFFLFTLKKLWLSLAANRYDKSHACLAYSHYSRVQICAVCELVVSSNLDLYDHLYC